MRQTGPSEIQPDPWEPSAATCDDVQNLLDSLTERMHDRDSGETFLECKACGEVDGHTPQCFVPAMKAWVEGDTVVVATLSPADSGFVIHCLHVAAARFREHSTLMRQPPMMAGPEFSKYVMQAERLIRRLTI